MSVHWLKPFSAPLCLTIVNSIVSSGLAGDAPGLPNTRVVPLERLRLRPLRLALGTGVLDDDPHAALAVVVGKIAHDPDARMVHLDDGRDALGRPEPEHRHVLRRRHRIAVERDDFERVSGQREAADFAGAGVQDVEQHAFALLHADGLAVPEHLAVDGEEVVADLEALGLFLGLVVGLLAEVLEVLDRLAGEEVHRHVAAAAEGRLELLQHQKHLAVVGAGLVLRLDVDRPDLAGVGAAVEVAAGHDMRVVEAEARRLRHERDAAHAVRRDERRAFLGRAVDIARDHLAVPVHQLRRVGVVVDIDRRRAALP